MKFVLNARRYNYDVVTALGVPFAQGEEIDCNYVKPENRGQPSDASCLAYNNVFDTRINILEDELFAQLDAEMQASTIGKTTLHVVGLYILFYFIVLDLKE